MTNETLGVRLTQWDEIVGERLATQLSLQAVIEEQIAVEFQFLVPEVALTPHLLSALYQASVMHASGLFAQIEAGAEQAWREQVPQDQHENVEIVIESVSVRFITAYDDALRRHWSRRPADLVESTLYVQRLREVLFDHVMDLQALLEQGHAGDALQGYIQAYQQAWFEQAPSKLLA
ncbi:MULTISPECIES: hypothetical protein [Pseudomonas]|uniref:hypothetical protein n=1 Tax=Pseudomonas TaxID=286 RepID=UPI001E5064B3|nr:MULTISPECIES: hypothetical protein [Pseudomonas]MCE1117869.1 hypothetical protein [Pseudomonas sp. NMI795_08]